jgi:uncharacterized protein YecE (DUF72 family)
MLTHELKLEPIKEAFDLFQKMLEICKILKAEILHFQTPSSFIIDRKKTKKLKDFFSSVKRKKIRIAMETRFSTSKTSYLANTLQDLDIIDCVDLLKTREPAYYSDILYARILGRNFHNIYQPLDSELKQIKESATQDGVKKAIVIMHTNRMFKDAARFKIYIETGNFPMVTEFTGKESLIQVLQEDTTFPCNKRDLIDQQGWKIIDLTSEQRVHASFILRKFPKKTYYGMNDIIQISKGINFG